MMGTKPGQMMTKYKHIFSLFMILSACITLPGCSAFKKDKGIAEKPPVEKMYTDATLKLSDGNYQEAIDLFEDIERTYPYSPLANKADLMIGYAHYRDGAYDDAISALNRFIQFHPGNKDIAYAYYLKALCYYEQITDIGRDQGVTEQARGALKEVVARFPESEYARDAHIKLDLVSDHLAGKEMEIGRFYLNKAEPIAAINRFKSVVDDYQTTSHVPEALERLVECYLTLGVVPEAQKYAAVLGNNYPGSKWYQHSYKLMKKYGVDYKKPNANTTSSDEGSIWSRISPFGRKKTDTKTGQNG